MSANFDHIARPYRWLEYATLGHALERCRNRHLPGVAACKRALILGDGDGRFTARLLPANPSLEVDAMDSSATMLKLLRDRCGPSPRLHTHQCEAINFTPSQPPDLIVAHFFFDCFTQPELDALIRRLAAAAAPNALWLVSDFRIPRGALHWPARLYIRMLYLAFRILTGLRVSRLPDYATLLRAAGLAPIAVHRSLFGLLTTELWQRAEIP
jgi:ubiquinone/menaquinone biosynthesis C-methylase UbiE